MENTLYYGDNLDILRRYIKDESVDLVYLDPQGTARNWLRECGNSMKVAEHEPGSEGEC